jgi:L-amino acid N-acyltransferase YncA
VVDSETRWRLVRKLKQRGEPQQTPPSIREARPTDLPVIKDLYNYFIRNTVVTFDDKPLDLNYWQQKFDSLSKFKLPFVVLVQGETEVIGFAYVAPWRQRSGYLKVVENSIFLTPAATGKKLGSKLLADLIQRSAAAGVKEIIAVIADRGADASIRLHEKHGFVEQGHLAKVGIRFGKPIGSYLYSLSLKG